MVARMLVFTVIEENNEQQRRWIFAYGKVLYAFMFFFSGMLVSKDLLIDKGWFSFFGFILNAITT